MNNSFRFLLFFFLPLFAVSAQEIPSIESLTKQLLMKDDLVSKKFPVYTMKGEWTFSEKPNWFSGFNAGELWIAYEVTGDTRFRERALQQADFLLQFVNLDNTHDMGFIFFPSLVKAYKTTGNEKYREGAITAAKMLAKRFNAAGRFLRAWGKLGTDDREGWSIIDTMMNLELLFWATQETGDYTFYDIAYTHALTCLRNHIRPDFSSYHVVIYDPQSGVVVKKQTHQGIGDETTWARGQAWGIYGFAKAYSYTKDTRFLDAAKGLADYYFSRLPDDFVPYWDLSLSGDSIPRDASAAAIAARGSLLISELSVTKTDVEKYRENFERTALSVLSQYSFLTSKRPKEQGLMLHTVYNKPKNMGVDESYPCGDYYFMELYQSYAALHQQPFAVPNAGRYEKLINEGWWYLQDEVIRPDATGKWIRVDLPHTWNAIDVYDEVPGYRRAAGWYMKDLYVPQLAANQKAFLCFEGVNTKSEIFVNGSKAGEHTGGYIGFDIDITKFLKADTLNTFLVKADNSIDIHVIPSQKADFNIFGGITRNVRLRIVQQISLAKPYITTPEVSAANAKTTVTLELKGTVHKEKKYELHAVIKDEKEQIAAKAVEKLKNVQDGSPITVSLPEIKKPRLWSPSSPSLYTVKLLLLADGKLIDSCSERIGYRWFEFREKGAFYLNGERLLLRGTHRHEEISGLGNAIPDSLHRNDIRLIKELGANFIRLAHYPQADEIYKSCDEMGLLVWDEVPWCRGGMGDAEWQGNTKRLLREQILRNLNHPSIIMWSVGNESDWLPDFPGGDNADSLLRFTKELHDICKELDPSRPTTARKFEAGGKVVDVFSPSMWPGWYSEVFKNYERVLTTNRNKFARLFHAEYGGDSHVGRHTETPVSGEGFISADDGSEKPNQSKVKNIANEGDWSESYIVNLFDWYLRAQESLDWFSGSAQWIFRDFGTPLRPENPLPYVNQKGLVDLIGTKKDAYYVYKSYWTSTPEFCYIISHSWKFRTGPKGVPREVKVFSNCDSVELFCNGVSQGGIKKNKTKYPASGLLWKVNFSEGGNTLLAKGFVNGKQVTTDSTSLEYTSRKTDKPDEFRFTQTRLSNGNYLVTATVVDGNGNHCVDFNERVYFSLLGSGSFVANYGTPTRTRTPEAASGSAQIEVKTVPSEQTILEVRTQDLKGFYYTIKQ